MKSVLTGILVVVLSVPVAMAASRGIRIVSNEGEQVGEYQASYALLIGVSDYTAGWPDLQSVPEELVKVSTSLADRGFEITQLHNPTTDELSQGFKDFINRHGYKRDNRLLFFFSGHGYTRDNGKKGYLVPSDAPDPRRDEEGFLRKSYPMTDLLALARRGLKYVRASRVTDDKQALRRRGAEYLRKGSYVLAIQEYSWLIEADPKDADAYLKRASAFQYRGQLDLALRDYTQALALNANLVHAYFGRASIYRAKGQSSLAKKELLKLARLDRRTIAAANLSDEQLKTLQALQKTIRAEQKKRTSQQGRKERKF